jgi:hypothetical protein
MLAVWCCKGYDYFCVFLCVVHVLCILWYSSWVWRCLTPCGTIFQLYRGGQFYWWRKQVYLEETIDMTQVQIYGCVDVPCVGMKLTVILAIVNDGIGRCKSNYHTITTTAVPRK